ncbi:pyridoxamine 5'-phosphate oxidase [Cryobacterium sp. TMT2-10]|uniref:Pyridoxine/pyridoxamine 5'-phosphate oxidase n=1 Tax=Cryobacterium shii TaxID=1259235 RepID=A0AAQ2HES8_9MICO|nr:MULTISPECIES: pyridoxamine 5'-phosphate oxidase [Cryobacterium]TFC42523.1 pyridoxamine 5'-phosphate oxidase [Cryobacterium shii]TFD18639.1 pyridoxamine 5'-phosphate oxidase [Cryobacterium sp. TMT4-10]TFD36637.1 pyridoxamine 5'-phosphate oxidase [Cryobacterium sp. TMT2-10]
MESLTSHTDYGAVGLNKSGVDPDPMIEFAAWLAAAEQAGLYEPNAMVVGTVDPDGRPSSRTVLLKGLDGSGFEFVSNYGSHKGRALAANPGVSLLFPWFAMQRQVIVYGTAHPTDAATSDAYFARRPRAARIAAVASDQSQPIASRALLEEQVRRVEARYPGDTDIPRPDDWGGYRVTPHAIEFWQGRTSRLHDRLRFTAAAAGGWTLERLQP